MPGAVVLAVFGFCFFRAFGVACHVPWFAGILPDRMRGRFFATEQAVTSSVGVVALLSCAALFAFLPPYPSFVLVYCTALFGSAMAVVSLLRLPPGPPCRNLSRAWAKDSARYRAISEQARSRQE